MTVPIGPLGTFFLIKKKPNFHNFEKHKNHSKPLKISLCGAGSENRTRTLGSEAPHSTIKLYPRYFNIINNFLFNYNKFYNKFKSCDTIILIYTKKAYELIYS